MAGRYGPTANPRIASLLRFRPEQLAQAAAPVMLGLLGLLAAVLLWRRLAGALSEPLSTPAMFAAGATLTALAALLRLAWYSGNRRGGYGTPQSASTPSSARSGMLFDCGVSGLLAAVAASITLPTNTAAGLLLLWGPPLLGESVWWAAALVGLRQQRVGRSRWLGWLGGQGVARADQTACRGSIVAVSEQAVSEQTVQHIIRTRSADGKERLTGWLRLDFAPGQRTAVAHVAFCPPMDGQPVLTVRQRSGPACRVKTAQALPYGARVELRLVQEHDQAQQVVLELEAHC